MGEIKIKTISYEKPAPEQECKLYDLGNGVIEIETPQIRGKPHNNTWRKINKYEMVNTEDGEIIETKQSTNRVESNLSRFKKQKKYVFRLLLNNFAEAENNKIIVLIFENDVSDLDNCYKVTKSFRSKLERKLKTKIRFVLIALFQSETKLSYEMWIKVDIDKISVSNEELTKMWRSRKCLLCRYYGH